MPTYRLNFIDADPWAILSPTADGSPASFSTWTGPSTADGTAVITDNNTGADGLVLDNIGENAVADLTLGATSVSGVTVSALESWTLLDTVTGETFQVVTFFVPSGSPGTYFTLSEQPLINGRSYQTLDFSNTADSGAGDPAFSYQDFFEGTAAVDGTSGDDLIDTTYVDGDGDGVNDGIGAGALGDGDFIDAAAGNDSVSSGSGDDTVQGGLGNDTVDGGAGDDSLLGGDDDDTLYDGLGADTLIGGDGNDLLVSQNQGDTPVQAQSLDGGAGDDTIRIEGDFSAIETIAGGTGTDELQLLPTDGRNLNVSMDSGVVLDGVPGDQFFSGIENITTGAGDDTIVGDGADNVLDGGAGADSISSGAGNDTVLGGDTGAGSAIISVTETFNSGALNGWALDDPGDGTLSHDTAAGPDGSGAAVFDDAQGGDEYLVAPASFLANFPTTGTVTAATFSFDIQLGSAVDPSNGPLQITGNGQTINLPFTLDFGQLGSFQTITVDLLDAAAAGVSEADLQAILTNVTDLRFDIDTNINFPVADTVVIDNIALDMAVDYFDSDTLDGGAGDDVLDGGDGADSLIGGDGNDTLSGGDGNDTLLGDDIVPAPSNLDWTLQGPDGTDLSTGFTQDTGDVDVTVSFASFGANNSTFTVETTDTNYVDGGEPFDPNSSLYLTADDTGLSSTTTLNFAASTGADVENAVENVSFRINDIDWFDANHLDEITITALDPNGNPVAVTLTPAGNDTVSGNTITAGLTLESAADAAGSVLVEIAGPVSEIQISYFNSLTGPHGIYVTDVHFTTIPTVPISSDVIDGGAGNDSIDGMSGNDTLTGGAGDDTLQGGIGNDTVEGGADNDFIDGGVGDDLMTGGAGNDTFAYTGGADTITDFNAGTSGGIRDGAGDNNDFIDLTPFYDTLYELWADYQDDGVLNQTNALDGLGNAVDYSDNQQFGTGESLTFTSSAGAFQLFSAENTGVVCFTPGTMIQTEHGEIPIEHLRRGDRVQTRDSGLQEIRWISARSLGQKALQAAPRLMPVLLKAADFGLTQDLIVSQQHGVLLHSADAGGSDVLYRAKHLAEMAGGGARIMSGRRSVVYIHLLFDKHEIIYSNGVPSESLYPGKETLRALAPEAMRELFQIHPDLFHRQVADAFGAPAASYSQRKNLPEHLGALRRAA